MVLVEGKHVLGKFSAGCSKKWALTEKNFTLSTQFTRTTGLHWDFDTIFYGSLLFNDAIPAEPTLPEGVHLV